jgi:type VI secretion system secreted protein VgrG
MLQFRLRLVWLIGFLLGFCAPVLAAGNPDIDNLQRSTVVRFIGHEAISSLFTFEIDLASSPNPFNFTNVLGQSLTVTPVPGRVVNGLIESIEQIGNSGRNPIYRIHLVPTVAKLQYRITSRTFYNMTLSDVVSNVLEDAGISPYDMRIVGSFSSLEMVVQYQESDWDFISRLLEEGVIHYHFEPTNNGHKIVFSDYNAGFPMLPEGQLTLASRANPRFQSFSRGQSLHAGTVQVSDYNWRTPTASISATANTTVFQYLQERVHPAGVSTNGEAASQAQLRLAERIAHAQRCSGQSTYTYLQAGYRFRADKASPSGFQSKICHDHR